LVGRYAVSSTTGTVDGLTNPQYSYDGNGNLTCASPGGGCSGTIGRTMNLTSFNMAASIDQDSNSLSVTYDNQHQRLQQVNTVSGTATTTTVYLSDAASGAMSQRVAAAGATPTDWLGFNWGSTPWGGTTANALPTWTDYMTIDGQIVAQRNVQYPLANRLVLSARLAAGVRLSHPALPWSRSRRPGDRLGHDLCPCHSRCSRQSN
jgi:hypothetical protein